MFEESNKLTDECELELYQFIEINKPNCVLKLSW